MYFDTRYCKLYVTSLFCLFLLQFFLIGIIIGAVQQVTEALCAVLAWTWVCIGIENKGKEEGTKVTIIMIIVLIYSITHHHRSTTPPNITQYSIRYLTLCFMYI